MAVKFAGLYIPKTLSRVLVWLISTILVVLIVLQAAVLFGVQWLKGGEGQAWIEAHLQQAVSESGYTIDISGYGYVFPNGLQVSKMSISDAEAVIVDMIDVDLRPGLVSLALKRLDVGIHADKVIWYRLPQSPEPKQDSKTFSLSPFTLPDLYFSDFSLSNLTIQELDIQEDVFGYPLKLSPDLSSSISFGDKLTLKLNLDLREQDESTPFWMPRHMKLRGWVDPKTLDVDLKNLEVANSIVSITGKGKANVSQNSMLDLQVITKTDRLKALLSGKEGAFKATTKISGTLETPKAETDGWLSLKMLKNQGFSDVDFQVTDPDVMSVSSGKALIETTYRDEPMSVSSDFDYAQNALVLNNLEVVSPFADVDQGQLTARFEDGEGEAKALNVEAKGGDIVASGMTVSQADIGLTLKNILDPWSFEARANAASVRMSDALSLSSLSLAVKEVSDDSYGVDINARGQTIVPFSMAGNADVSGLKSKDIKARDIKLDVGSQGSSLSIKGAASLENLDLNISTNNFAFSVLPVSLPSMVENVRASGSADVSGSPSDPVINSSMTLTPMSVAENVTLNLNIGADYRNSQVNAVVDGAGTGISHLKSELTLPVNISLYPFEFNLNKQTTLGGSMVLNGEVSTLSQLVMPRQHDLSGDINVNASIGGTLGNPDIEGKASLRGGSYAYSAYGVALEDISLDADLDEDRLVVSALSANDGQGGELNGSGRFSFVNRSNTNMEIFLKNYKLLDSDRASGTTDMDITVSGREEGYLISGDVNLGEVEVIIPERFQRSIPSLNIIKKDEKNADKRGLDLFALDMNVIADNRVFVRGWGLDAEFGGELRVDGTLDDPQLNGVLEARRGRYEEFGKKFQLDRAVLRFQGSAPPSPYLDIVATTQAEDVEASVIIEGELDNPKLSMASVPSLPQDEIASRILFGRDLRKITPLQALRLKQTLDRFSGNGGSGFDPLAELRSITGFDDITVDTDDEGETSVGVGKYLTDKVYLEVEKGAGQDSGAANLQIEVTPSVTVESKVGQEAQTGAGIEWRWDY